MNRHQKAKLYNTLWIFLSLMITTYFIIDAISSGMHFYAKPSEMTVGQTLHLGGQVKTGSVTQLGTSYDFQVYDDETILDVHYNGTLPPLFKEGNMVVLVGQMTEERFNAERVYAKHDEYYKIGEHQ